MDSFESDWEFIIRSELSECSSSEANDSDPVVRKPVRLKVKTPPAPEKTNFCQTCNKQFSSGKAYGGHVRIHSKEQVKKKIKKKTTTKKRNLTATTAAAAGVAGAKVKIINCFLCGKVFKSMHSLFGHMRRHPDRSWKGIRPPPSPPPQLPEIANPRFQLEGSGCSPSSSSSLLVNDDVMTCSADVQEAAEGLMLLSYDLHMISKNGVGLPRTTTNSTEGRGVGTMIR